MGEFLAIQYNDFDEAVAGTETRLYAFPPEIVPRFASLIPAHGMMMGILVASAEEQHNIMGNIYDTTTTFGIDSTKKTVVATYTGQPTADQTVAIGGKTYTVKTSGASGDEFNIGSDATETYTALVAKVNTDTATTLCTAEISGSGATGTITFTANLYGSTGFTFTEGFTNLTAVVTAGITGTPATLPITIVGTNFRKYTQNTIVVTADTLLDGTGDEICIQFDTPATSATTAVIAAGLKTVAGYALLNTTIPTDEKSHSRVFSIRRASRMQISNALKLIFGTSASTAFTVASSTITLHAMAAGSEATLGNYTQIRTFICNSFPDNLPFVDNNGNPLVLGKGGGIPLGECKSFTFDLKAETQQLDSDNRLTKPAPVFTGFAPTGSFIALQTLNERIQGILAGIVPLSFDAGGNLQQFGGRAKIQSFGLVAVQTSKRAPGQYNIWVIWRVRTGGFSVKNDKTDISGVTYAVNPDSINNQGCPVGFKYSYREIAA